VMAELAPDRHPGREAARGRRRSCVLDLIPVDEKRPAVRATES
jgi:hypothetical protein